MKREDIKRLRSAGIHQWQIAEKMGIREDALSRKLRHELSAEDEAKIKKAIAEILLEKGDDNHE